MKRAAPIVAYLRRTRYCEMFTRNENASSSVLRTSSDAMVSQTILWFAGGVDVHMVKYTIFKHQLCAPATSVREGTPQGGVWYDRERAPCRIKIQGRGLIGKAHVPQDQVGPRDGANSSICSWAVHRRATFEQSIQSDRYLRTDNTKRFCVQIPRQHAIRIARLFSRSSPARILSGSV